MRILQIRLQNLNSLVGEWEIDLTHPAYGADGIFAITGPTGAGKSTILDALCLALYGRTPRLDSVNKGANELMSRQTGECSAEVTFETAAGRFRCHWSQHKARSRVDGALQSQRHEIVDATSGEILESKIKDVAARVATVTGMTFTQFTRSILLAQGGFAAFLQAGSDERAPVLEQITGSEIYSSISKAVHERRSMEGRRLEEHEAALAGMDLLTPEAEAAHQTRLEQFALRDAELAAGLEVRTRALAWLEGIAQLERELSELGRRAEDWQLRREAFEPQRKRLEAAARALELIADHRELASLRQAQASEQDSLGQGRELLLTLEAAHEAAVAAHRSREAQLEARLREQQAAQPLLRQVREMDLLFLGKAGPIAHLQSELAEGEAGREKLAQLQAGDRASLQDARETLAALKTRREATKADERLVEQLEGLRERIGALQGLFARQVTQAQELTVAEAQRTAATGDWQGKVAAQGELAGVLQACAARLDGRKAELEARLEARPLADWRKVHASRAEEVSRLERLLETVRSLTTELSSEAERTVRLEAGTSEVRSRAASLEERRREAQAQDREIELVETQLTLLRKIDELEQQRLELQDGEPCPLCGALEHPFAVGNVPAQDQTLQRLTALRAERKAVSLWISEEQVRLARLEKDLEQAAVERVACLERIEQARRRIAASGEAAPPEPAALEARIEEARILLEQARGVVEAAERDEREIAALQDALERAREAHGIAERETLSALHRRDAAHQAVARGLQELDQTRVRVGEALERLRVELGIYGVAEAEPEALQAVLDELTGRRDRRLALAGKMIECERSLAVLEARTKQQAERLTAWAGELEKKSGQLQVLVQERQTLARARAEAFGERHPDEEEASLAAAVEASSRSRETARQELAGARLAFDAQQERLRELSGSITLRQPRLLVLEEAFSARLAAAGFLDETDFGSACLEEPDRRLLADSSRQLSEEFAALAARQAEKSARLSAERSLRVSEQTSEELAASREALLAEQKALLQEIGGIRQRLQDNANLKATQLDRARARDAQRLETQRWDRLHDLIGSADGKKFRNFAQGLTFELMVGHANDQLRKMSDRYLLVRDRERPLELNVIDNWQAGQIRSTKNLSGGESFLVSLALALGLSRMASRKVRVDSLFLDEGFGTLDDEALECALGTLASLRQEGLLIGVISHVAALKERIAVQIRVTPTSGGRSELSGPGCRNLGVFPH